MSEVEPLSADELAMLRLEHLRGLKSWPEVPGFDPEPPTACCFMCGEDWPCDIARLLATLDAERARADEALALLREMDVRRLARIAMWNANRQRSTRPWLGLTRQQAQLDSGFSVDPSRFEGLARDFEGFVRRADALIGNGSTDEKEY